MQNPHIDKHPGSDDKPDEAFGKLGSAQPGRDLFDAESPAAAGVPIERVPTEVRPVEVVPTAVIPTVLKPVDGLAPETRPVDYRPREVFPAEGR